MLLNEPLKPIRSDVSITSSPRVSVKALYLSRRERELCHPGYQVVILRKDERKRAEGGCVTIIPTSKAHTHQQRDDIHITTIAIVPYHDESLNRHGVAVIV